MIGIRVRVMVIVRIKLRVSVMEGLWLVPR